MPTNVECHRQARAASTIGRQPAPMDGLVNVGPALACSPVTRLCGRPYPVQFRAQGALDAWTRALGNTGLWSVAGSGHAVLANSDVDLSLPMSLVAPPYRAEYLRFGETTMRYLMVPSPRAR